MMHVTEMTKLQFEEHLYLWIQQLGGINRLDETLREAVLKHDAQEEPIFHKGMLLLYSSWLGLSGVYLDALSAYESKYGQVRFAEEFRSCCREVRGILTEDAEFFKDEAFVELMDRAIDEHRRGETTPM